MSPDDERVLPHGRCPICDAEDAYIGERTDRPEYFVECLNCGVYRATRKAFRHFQYLRWRAERDGLTKLERLATLLHGSPAGANILLEYENWEQLIIPSKGDPELAG